MCFEPFGCIWDRKVALQNSGQNGPNVQNFVPRSRVSIFLDEPRDPLHWSLNSCFGAFRTVWVYLRPFGCLTKLGAKHSELVQKFVPRSRVGIFRNESTRSTPWDPKLMFLCFSYHLDPFGTVRLPYETQGKMGRTSAKDRATKSSRIFFATNPPNPPHWTLNSCFGAFRTIWVHLGPFGCLTKLGAKRAEKCKSSCHEVVSEFFATNPLDPLHWTLNSCFGAFRTIWVHLRPFGCPTKLGAKRFELVQKFVPRRRVGVFRDERTRPTPLDPKQMLWCVLYHLHAFGTVRLPYETRCKTGRTSAKVRSTKSR